MGARPEERTMANLIVEISWDAGVVVKVISLRDNNVELLKTSLRDDDGKITLEWEASDTIAHFIDWDLWSGSETMKGPRPALQLARDHPALPPGRAGAVRRHRPCSRSIHARGAGKARTVCRAWWVRGRGGGTGAGT
jgi:hypothetical protein